MGGAKTYAYNNRNRMSAATVGALAWGYTYNGLEQLAIRTQTAGGAGITHFIHDPQGNVIAETAGGGATGATGTVREYIYLPEAEIAPTYRAHARARRPADRGGRWRQRRDTRHLLCPRRPLEPPDPHDQRGEGVGLGCVWQPWGGSHAITGTAALNARFPGQWFQSERACITTGTGSTIHLGKIHAA